MTNPRGRPRGIIVLTVLRVRGATGCRIVTKVIRYCGCKNVTEGAVDVGKRKKAQEMVAILKTKLIEGNGLKT